MPPRPLPEELRSEVVVAVEHESDHVGGVDSRSVEL